MTGSSASPEESTLYMLASLVLLGFLVGSAMVWFSFDNMKSTAVLALQRAPAGGNGGAAGGAGTGDSGAGVSGNTLTFTLGGQSFSREIEGDPNATVTIAEFSDYECPYCMQALPTIQQLMEEYRGKVRLVHMNFVVHPDAHLAALAGECAGEQGKYWEMHDAIFSQKKYDNAGLAQTAQSIGLDGAKFSACLSSGKYEPALTAQQAAGSSAGVEGTPTFIIGKIQNGQLVGTPVVGAVPLSQFESAVKAAMN
ncbi:Thioredoxin [uncultured archaeon]|nr:Thioredoxin [uncultured archaeon]